MRRILLKQIIALFISLAIFCDSTLHARVALSALNERISNFPLLTFQAEKEHWIPARLGMVREDTGSPTSGTFPTVIFIQDIHMNYEAQKNIAEYLLTQIPSLKVDLVLLEGAFGDVSLQTFQTYPFRSAVIKTAATLLRYQQIPGSICAALVSPTFPHLFGIDDRELYNAHVNAYRLASGLQRTYRKKWDSLNRVLERQKRIVFNSDLYRFDRCVLDYHQGTKSLPEYVKQWHRYGRYGFRLMGPNMKTLAECLAFEQLIDSKALIQEREIFFDRIQHSSKKDNGDLPNLNLYLRYRERAEQINSQRLIEEIMRAEKLMYQNLAHTNLEKNLVSLSQQLFGVRKLIDFSLGRSEWERYQADKLTSPRLQTFFPRLNDFEKFYLAARSRDLVLANNAWDKINLTGSKTSVLVAGGFHSEGIKAFLKRKGARIICIAPRVTQVDLATATTYLSVFDQDKSPLEKIFHDRHLFIPPEVWKPSTEITAALQILRYELLAKRANYAMRWFRQLILGSAHGLFWAFQSFGYTVFLIGRPQAKSFSLVLTSAIPVLFAWDLLPTINQNPASALAIDFKNLNVQVPLYPFILGILFLGMLYLYRVYKRVFRHPKNTTHANPWTFGFYWKPFLNIRPREFWSSKVKEQIYDQIRKNIGAESPKDRALKILKIAQEKGIEIGINPSYRGADIAGSALDLTPYQRILGSLSSEKLSTTTMAVKVESTIRFVLIPEEERITSEGTIEIQDVTSKFGTTTFYSKADQEGLQRNGNGNGLAQVELNDQKETKRGMKDMAGFIFNLFGLGGGIRILDDTNIPGGVESSSVRIASLIEIASILSGANLSQADIWLLSWSLENDVFQGVTGGQGPLAAFLGGVQQIFWIDSPSGVRAAFSKSLIPKERWREIEDHILLVDAGEKTEEGWPTIMRAGPLVNKMWLDLLKNRDEDVWNDFQNLPVLASQGAKALQEGDYKTLIDTINSVYEIRNKILRRWMSLMLDALHKRKLQRGWWKRIFLRKSIYVPDYAVEFQRRIMDEKKYPEYKPVRDLFHFSKAKISYLRQLSLYSLDPIDQLIKKALKRGYGGMPVGAGGPGGAIAFVSELGRAELENFADLFAAKTMPFEITGPSALVGFDQLSIAHQDLVKLPAAPTEKYLNILTGEIRDTPPDSSPTTVVSSNDRTATTAAVVPTMVIPILYFLVAQVNRINVSFSQLAEFVIGWGVLFLALTNQLIFSSAIFFWAAISISSFSFIAFTYSFRIRNLSNKSRVQNAPPSYFGTSNKEPIFQMPKKLKINIPPHETKAHA